METSGSPPPGPRPPFVQGPISRGNQLASAIRIEPRLCAVPPVGPELPVLPRSSFRRDPDRFPKAACGQVVDHRLQTFDFGYGRFIARIASADRESGRAPATQADDDPRKGRESNHDRRSTRVSRHQPNARTRQFDALFQFSVKPIPLGTLDFELPSQSVQQLRRNPVQRPESLRVRDPRISLQRRTRCPPTISIHQFHYSTD